MKAETVHLRSMPLFLDHELRSLLIGRISLKSYLYVRQGILTQFYGLILLHGSLSKQFVDFSLCCLVQSLEKCFKHKTHIRKKKVKQFGQKAWMAKLQEQGHFKCTNQVDAWHSQVDKCAHSVWLLFFHPIECIHLVCYLLPLYTKGRQLFRVTWPSFYHLT